MPDGEGGGRKPFVGKWAGEPSEEHRQKSAKEKKVIHIESHKKPGGRERSRLSSKVRKRTQCEKKDKEYQVSTTKKGDQRGRNGSSSEINVGTKVLEREIKIAAKSHDGTQKAKEEGTKVSKLRKCTKLGKTLAKKTWESKKREGGGGGEKHLEGRGRKSIRSSF